MRNEPRRGHIEDTGRTFNFGRERSDAGLTCSAFGPRQRRTRNAGPQAPDGDSSDGQFVSGTRGDRQRCGIEVLDKMLGLVKVTDQEQTLERIMRRTQRLQRPVEVARDERDLGLGDYATRASDGLLWAEGAGRVSEQPLGANEIA